MADIDSKQEQFEYDFVESPPEDLTCSICMKVLCEPHMVNCCAQQFCGHCLEMGDLPSLSQHGFLPHVHATN
jgi:hypothetical protein